MTLRTKHFGPNGANVTVQIGYLDARVTVHPRRVRIIPDARVPHRDGASNARDNDQHRKIIIIVKNLQNKTEAKLAINIISQREEHTYIYVRAHEDHILYFTRFSLSSNVIPFHSRNLINPTSFTKSRFRLMLLIFLFHLLSFFSS